MSRAIRLVLTLLVLGGIALALFRYAHDHPEDMPWTPLDLGEPIGMFTGRKLAALTGDAPACRAVLDQTGVNYTALPARNDGASCRYDDAVRFRPGGAQAIRYAPGDLGVSCPVAAALASWEWNVVQPAAREHLGGRVVAVDTFGSYSCRRLYGRSEGGWSEHATADAVDIAGFRLENGQRITVARDWTGDDPEARFLRAVRDGACRLFATTLSPDYNAAHHDHLHLDQAERGALGGGVCR